MRISRGLQAASLVVLLAASCADPARPAASGAPPVAGGSPAASATALSTPPNSSTPLDAPSLEFVVLTRSGHMQRFDSTHALGPPAKACPGAGVSIHAAPVGRHVAVVCEAAAATGEGFVFDVDSGQRLRSFDVAWGYDAVAWSPDAKSLAVRHTADASEPGIVLLDVATGQTTKVLDRSSFITDLLWSSLGLTHFAMAPPQQGAWVLDNTRWRRLSDKTVVAASADGSALLSAREGMGLEGELWTLKNGTELALSRSHSEIGLMIDDQRVLAWRGGSPARFVVYAGGSSTEVSAATSCTRGQSRGEWFVCGAALGQVEALSLAMLRTVLLKPGFPADAVASTVLSDR